MTERPYAFEDFDAAMTPARLTLLRVIGLAYVIVPLLYVGIGLYVTQSMEAPLVPPLGILVIALAALGLVLVLLSLWLPGEVLRRTDIADAFVNGLRQGRGGRVHGRIPILQALLTKHYVIRMALVEGAGVLGLVLAILAGHLVWTDWHWSLCFLPCGIAAVWAILTFPTLDSQKKVFRHELGGRP